LKGVVITVGLKSYLTEPFGPLLRSGWRHSVACAMVAERTAGWGGFDKDFAYTAGIMHDIGRIAMAIAMPEPYARVLRAGADDPSDLLKTECAVCGINHCQVGHSLVKAWNLPEGFLDVIASHHSPAALLQGTTSVLRPSCRIANSLGFGVVEYRCPVEYSDLVVEFPERVRNRFPADAKDLASEIAAEINVIESV
jgi:putative nucleotidyltransferase with HDIG domain